MSHSLIISLTFFAVFACCFGDDPTPVSIEPSAEELSKEEIYNINTDMYCITELVIVENLLDLESPENLYTSIIGDDIKDIDCEAILKEYVSRVHKRLRQDFKKKGASTKTLNCFMSKIDSLGYDKMRFRFNALYGIEVEKTKKDQLRSEIDKEIGDTVEQAVDECWQKELNKSTETQSAESQNNL